MFGFETSRGSLCCVLRQNTPPRNINELPVKFLTLVSHLSESCNTPSLFMLQGKAPARWVIRLEFGPCLLNLVKEFWHGKEIVQFSFEFTKDLEIIESWNSLFWDDLTGKEDGLQTYIPLGLGLLQGNEIKYQVKQVCCEYKFLMKQFVCLQKKTWPLDDLADINHNSRSILIMFMKLFKAICFKFNSSSRKLRQILISLKAF